MQSLVSMSAVEARRYRRTAAAGIRCDYRTGADPGRAAAVVVADSSAEVPDSENHLIEVFGEPVC